MKNYLKLVFGCMVMFLFFQCKQEYIPKVEESDTRLLVVEGFINSGSGPTTIHLSRSTDLNSTILNEELNAQVIVKGENGSQFDLFDNGSGEYSVPQLILDNSVKYRLYIKTSDGKEYASDYSPVKYTPPIDSITWQMENSSVQIYVNAHDDLNNTKYYRWTYSETWEFHSRYLKGCFYIIDPTTSVAIDIKCGGDPDTTIYKCWRTQNSTNLILGSSEKLTEDRIHLPVRYIEPQADELTILYYIDLKQYALSHEAYLFYQKMKKNTEQIGSLFDPQPSEINGNMHCLTDSTVTAIGYVEVSQAQEKTFFIHNSDLPVIWISQIPCGEILQDNKPPLNQGLIPTRLSTTGPFNTIASFYAADPMCVDCTLRGTNIKPSFWP